jgi:6-phosphogluconolactonase (cycloisomerase 2 family)
MKKYALLASFAVLVSSAAIAQNGFVYTNDNVNTGIINENPANTVSAFQVGAGGGLTLLPDSPFKTGGLGGGNSIDPEEIAIATQNGSNFLYAANDGSGTISGFKINSTTGMLTRIPGSPFLADGAPGGDYSLTATPSGKYLYATSDATTVIHIYEISSEGVLSEVGVPVQTGANSQGLKVTPNGKFLVVGEGSLTAVGVYNVAANGGLSAVANSPFAASATPFDLDVNCASNLVFVVDAGSVIDVYSMASDGSLTPVPKEPFTNGTSSTNGGVVLSPNNQFLFVTDTFSSEISSLAVSSDGALTQVPNSPFPGENWTGGIAATRNGKFVYSALFTVAQVDGAYVNAAGELKAVAGSPFSTGQAQTGVPTVITFPAPICSAQ